MSGKGDPRAIIDGLRKAADERRVLVYSAARRRAGRHRQTGLAGALDTEAERPSIGVFLNDGTGAKMGYYLRNEVHVTEGDCRADGRREMQVRVVVNYDAPPRGCPTTSAAPGNPASLTCCAPTCWPSPRSAAAWSRRPGTVPRCRSAAVRITTVRWEPRRSNCCPGIRRS